ncbi:hypothetical protein [Streptomyces sp. ME08-AFT2]|uniref:hypothetical protein n=1 Tax=Streptomyces sp. ME08-AFT2 TaxID=3028683 RepID=UPI0029BFEFD2|nr:hypothetical protein [Streptomyces sp. ME08-AFT2]
MNKDMRALLDKAREQGFRVRLCGSGHYIVAGRRGVVSVSATPTGGRSRTLANTRSKLRRLGAQL